MPDTLNGKGLAPSVILGFVVALIAMGLPLIGIAVNVYLGAFILAMAFILLAYGFWQWEKARSWGDAARASTLWILGIAYSGSVGFQIWLQDHKAHQAGMTNRSTAELGPKPPPSIPTNSRPFATSTTPQQSTPLEKPAKSHVQAKPKAPTRRESRIPAQAPPPTQPVAGPDSLVQSNSGGVNVQQGTTGINSPIINSPITIGDIPKTISPVDMTNVVRYFQQAKSTVKIAILADQYSGAAPFPDDLYDALKTAGWMMQDTGVNRLMILSGPGKPFQGAVIAEKGEPLKPGETVFVPGSDPIAFLGAVLDAYKIPRSLQRTPGQPDGLITVTFRGGFPK